MTSIRLTLLVLAGLASTSASQGPTPKPRGQKGEKRWLVELPEGFVKYARVPDGGRLPRLAPGKDELALLYFKGDGERGDLFLARSKDDAQTFLPSLPVEPEAGAIAAWEGQHTGSIALGPDGLARVAWIRAGETPAVCFRQETPDGLGELVELGTPAGLCGTTAIAVDDKSRVYVFYAAGEPVAEAATNGLRVWMRRSLDGKSFAEPVAVDRAEDGLSPLSGMTAHADEVMGTIFVLYRTLAEVKKDGKKEEEAATRSLSHMRLLCSEDHGESFETTLGDNRKSPRSSAHLSQQMNTTLAAWDAGGMACWSLIRRQLNKVELPIEAKDEEHAFRRTQVAAAASERDVLVAWLERPRGDPAAAPAIGWQLWQIDGEGRGRVSQGSGRTPAPEGGASIEGPAVLARRGGGFTILF